MFPLTPEDRGTLIANADDVANALIDKWGRAAVGQPKYTEERGWHIEVVGLLDDILMDTVLVFPTGGRDMVT